MSGWIVLINEQWAVHTHLLEFWSISGLGGGKEPQSGADDNFYFNPVKQGTYPVNKLSLLAI